MTSHSIGARFHRGSALVGLGLLIALAILSLQGSPLGPSPAQAATIVVDTGADTDAADGDCSLREAILNAEADAGVSFDCENGTGEDTIVFDDAVTYIILTDSLPSIQEADGLTIDGGGRVTIDGVDSHQVFEVDPSGVLTVLDLTVTAGGSNTRGPAANNEGWMLLDGVTITNTFAADDGPVFNAETGTLIIENSTLTLNEAGSDGGAIFNEAGYVEVTNSSITWNHAGSNGGGIATVSSNDPGTLLITASTIENNTANSGGGGISNRGSYAESLSRA